MQKKRAPEASGDEGHGRNAQKAAEGTRTYSYWRTPNIVGPKYQKYYQAKKKTGGVLEIAIFTWGRIVSGENEPTYRVFLHDGKYDTWGNRSRKVENCKYRTFMGLS